MARTVVHLRHLSLCHGADYSHPDGPCGGLNEGRTPHDVQEGRSHCCGLAVQDAAAFLLQRRCVKVRAREGRREGRM